VTATKEEIIEKLKQVIDPEINIDIYALGLIYDIIITNDEVKIIMTLTTPACPFAPFIIEEVQDKMEELGFEDPEVKLTFDPVWEPDDEVKMMLGLL
jgi:metal-sulfur cluster biosynthetic enzyme